MLCSKKSTLIGGTIGLCLLIMGIHGYPKEDKLVSDSELGSFKKAAVSSYGADCSKIGVSMLQKNGSAVDAAIATLLCEGVSSLHSTGLGGGFLMTIWDAKEKRAEFLNARETAPLAATKDMFKGNSTLAVFGGLAVAVPGELMGYWEAHKKYGKLKWEELFLPTIELCEKGIVVNKYIEESLRKHQKYILAEPTLAEILIDPKTNATWVVGDRLKRPKLKETLQAVAKDPFIFYNGSMGEELIKEIREFGGIMTMDDLRNYTVQWKAPISSKIGEYTMHTSSLPGSGLILNLILNVVRDIISTNDEGVFWQRMLETFKWAYAKRTELGDDNFEDMGDVIKNLTSTAYAEEIRKKIRDDWTSNDPEFYGAVSSPIETAGTVHVSVLAADGSAVSATATINQVLGASIRSRSTGIIFNDEMDNFSSPGMKNVFNLPPSPANFIKPGKRPLSSMVPTIVVDDKGEVQLVIGAAGGTKITTGVASAMVLNLWRGYDIKEAIDARRIHHQLFPMTIAAEPGFSPSLLKFFNDIGHNTSFYSGMGSGICAISKLNHPGISANSDYRRQGSVAGF